MRPATYLPRTKIQTVSTNIPQDQFGGLDHTLVPRPGWLWDMENMSCRNFPAISTRLGRKFLRQLAKPNGFGSRGDDLFWVDGTDFVYNNEVKGRVADSQKTCAKIGPYICIFPDKVYYNTKSGELKPMGLSVSVSATFTKYVYDAEGDAAKIYQGNAIRCGTKVPFDPSEAVVISGATNAANNRAAVIREILEDGKLLVFDNNIFAESETAQTVTMERKVPDMDYFVEFGNRLWGCKGDTIYASALGIPWRWYNLGNLSTDSYYVEAGSEGNFTGAFKVGGYPIFFKESHIHKVYGSKPTNFSCLETSVTGLLRGCDRSIANAGEQLLYIGQRGVVSYSGGIPYDIGEELGVEILEGAAGSDGRRYYLSARTSDGWTMYCYDTKTRLWTREDSVHAVQFAYAQGVLHYLDADGKIYAMHQEPEQQMPWMLETGDISDNGPEKEYVIRMLLRAEIHSGWCQAYVQTDSSGKWKPCGPKLYKGVKRTDIIPMEVQRCDHYRIRLVGQGVADIYSLTRAVQQGSYL